jgi:two-component system OmpR family response regulator
MRILVMESDPKQSEFFKEKLSGIDYQTDMTENLKDGDYYVDIRNYDLIIINSNLTDGRIPEMIKKIKEKSQYKTAVMLVSQTYNIEHELMAFENDADDYCLIGEDLRVFSARVKARLKLGGSSVIEIEDLVINPEEEKIIYKDTEIELKGKPFEVLTHLARHKTQIVSKEQLLDAIWEEPELVTPNVIEVAINQIRQKMDKPLGISTIETIRRRGYRFCYAQELTEDEPSN